MIREIGQKWCIISIQNVKAKCLYVCGGGDLHSKIWQKLHWFIVFHLSIRGFGSCLGGPKRTKVPRGDGTNLHYLPETPTPCTGCDGSRATTTGQPPPRIMHLTHHTRAIKFSLQHRVGARGEVLAARRLGTTGLRSYCFDTVQQKWVQHCCCCPCNTQLKR